MGKGGREFAVFAGVNAGELPELPVEVGLVAVAGFQSHVDKEAAGRTANVFQRSLKANQATVEFWSQSQAIVEQRDESPVAVAAFFDRLAYIGAGREPPESLGHGRVKAADRRKPRRQKRLEDIELPLRPARLNQPFPRFNCKRTPEILDRSMAAGELAGRHAKQQLGRPGWSCAPTEQAGPEISRT